MTMTEGTEEPNRNEQEHHETATGIGAVGGAAVGGGIGSAFGPLGTVVGIALGTVGGAIAGHESVEVFDLGGDDSYWRSRFSERTPSADDHDYEAWRPAYIYGWEARRLTWGRSWSEAEPQLRDSWSKIEKNVAMDWSKASKAIQEAWDRFEERTNTWLDEEEAAFRERHGEIQRMSGRPVDYSPAFRFGMLSRVRQPETRWDEIEEALAEAWDDFEDSAEMAWDSVRDFVRDGFRKLGQRFSGEHPATAGATRMSRVGGAVHG